MTKLKPPAAAQLPPPSPPPPPPLPSYLKPLARIEEPIFKGFCDKRRVLCFFKRHFSFSNFSDAPFFLNNNWYQSSEHFYQHSKAEYFGDELTAKKILAEVF